MPNISSKPFKYFRSNSDQFDTSTTFPTLFQQQSRSLIRICYDLRSRKGSTLDALPHMLSMRDLVEYLYSDSDTLKLSEVNLDLPGNQGR